MRTICHLLSLFQWLTVLSVILLEYLSYEKMGLARYLLYIKSELKLTLIAGQTIMIYQIGLLIGVLFLAFLLNLWIKKQKKRINVILIALVFHVAGIVLLLLESDKLRAYPIIVISLFVVILVQYIKIVLQFRIQRQNSKH